MTTIDSHPRVLAAALGEPGRLGGYVPAGPDAIYLLTYTDHAGWRLAAYQGSDRCWAATLPGDESDGGIRAAERGAETLLAGHGVRVTRWRHGDSAREIQARAEVATAHSR